MFWDFITLRPESTHQVMFLFSDRGIPDGYRHMNGYGSHTFKLVNAKNESFWCKFHYKVSKHTGFVLWRVLSRLLTSVPYATLFSLIVQTDQKIKNILSDKAADLASSDPDYSIRDLYNAIETKNYPSYTLSVQIMSEEQAKTYNDNPFDLTKVCVDPATKMFDASDSNVKFEREIVK